MERQFTATVYIVDSNRVLLIYHRKMEKWVAPGGHIDPNETPPEAAIREAKEETGLDISLHKQENIWIDKWNANSIERPYLCLLQKVPTHGNEPAHQHIDMVFIGTPSSFHIKENLRETKGARWFTHDEVKALKPDTEIFSETLEVLETIFEQFACPLPIS